MAKPGFRSGPISVTRQAGGGRSGPMISGGMPGMTKIPSTGSNLSDRSQEAWRQSRIGGLQGSPTFVEKYKIAK